MTPLQATIGMHFVALLWGASGIFGAVISAPSPIVTAGRSIFAITALLIIFRKKVFTELLAQRPSNLLSLVIIGALQGSHWIFFFESIKTGGITLALVTYATIPPMIAIMEILFLHAQFRAVILVAAVLSAAGVWIIHPLNSLSQLIHPGFVNGMISAISLGVMAILSKRLLTLKVGFLPLTFMQLGGAFLVSIPFAFGSSLFISAHDLLFTALLGVGCSAVGQTLFNYCLNFVRISRGSIIASMETPYGVLLAAIFLGQELTGKVVAGVMLVTLAAAIVSVDFKAKKNAT